MRRFWTYAKESVTAWIDDGAPSIGAALSYYTLFSIAPLLIIAISVAGLFFGAEAARGELFEQMRGLLGDKGAIAIQGLVESASRPGEGIFAATVGFITILIGATAVFGELQSALDRIWEVPPEKKGSGVWNFIRTRLLSFGMVLGVCFLLLVSLVASAVISAIGNIWSGPLGAWEPIMQVVNLAVSLLVFTGAFAVIYKYLPRADIAWRDVWVGAAVTSVLFAVGKFLIGLYIGKSGVTSGFGAAGALVALMVWVYYSAQVFLLGAEFTWVYARRRGSRAGEADAPADQKGTSDPHPAQSGANGNPPSSVPAFAGAGATGPRRVELEPALTPQARALASIAVLGLALAAILRR